MKLGRLEILGVWTTKKQEEVVFAFEGFENAAEAFAFVSAAEEADYQTIPGFAGPFLAGGLAFSIGWEYGLRWRLRASGGLGNLAAREAE